MATKDELYQEYEEFIGKVSRDADTAIGNARAKLRADLKALRGDHHKELKGIRYIDQKVKRSPR